MPRVGRSRLNVATARRAAGSAPNALGTAEPPRCPLRVTVVRQANPSPSADGPPAKRARAAAAMTADHPFVARVEVLYVAVSGTARPTAPVVLHPGPTFRGCVTLADLIAPTTVRDLVRPGRLTGIALHRRLDADDAIGLLPSGMNVHNVVSGGSCR